MPPPVFSGSETSWLLLLVCHHAGSSRLPVLVLTRRRGPVVMNLRLVVENFIKVLFLLGRVDAD
jgi:hypothetical protein